jgi:hypothetical protein
VNNRYLLIAVIYVAVTSITPNVDAYWPIYDPSFLGGHRQITRDAIDAINFVEYPDILRFKNQLIAGSGTEAHNPPGVPGDEERWFPEAGDWWSKMDDPEPEKKCVLEWYAESNFQNAYKTIGYICHNIQDLTVPAHTCVCIHGLGTGHLSDELEEYAFFHHGYATGNTEWVFSKNGWAWHYWLSDADYPDDDDDENGHGDNSPLPDIPDHNGDFKAEWGIPEYAFGTYGFDPSILPSGGQGWWPVPFGDPPGLNKGQDYFLEQPNASIVHEQLKKAYDDTVTLLKEKSKALPPWVGSVSFTPSRFFGPHKPTNISFEIQENRKSLVGILIFVFPGPMYLKDASGAEWSWRNVYLLPTGLQDMLPWRSVINVLWDGGVIGGELDEDGEYAVESLVVDNVDNNISSSTSGTIKYDKTPPTATISATVTYPH